MQPQSFPVADGPTQHAFPAGLDDAAQRRAPGAAALHVLVVEDDDPVRAACTGIAEAFGCKVWTASSVPQARDALAAKPFDVVFLDLRLPGGTGVALFEEIRSRHPRCLIVVMTAFASVTHAVELMRNGAADFLSKPFDLYQVHAVLQRAAERRQWTESSHALEHRLEAGVAAGTLIGHSPGMQRMFRIISKVAFTRHPVLITGERGTGKEVVARAIHANGPQAVHSFVPVDCDSLVPARLEAELFGFSEQTMPGLFTAAGEGTVLLKEIGSLDLALQARLLRLLEGRPPQHNQEPHCRFRGRLLAASSYALESLVEAGKFRKDLFYKLNVVQLRVPPLRERQEDILPLAETFLAEQRRDRGVPLALSEHVLASMRNYPWAGNVSELRSLIEHACTLSSGPILHFDDLSTQIRSFQTAVQKPEPEAMPDLPVQTLEDLEKQAILQALRQLKGDKVLAAKVLGIGKTTLYRKLKEYGIVDDAS